jgi:chemotaxis protein CheC
MRDDMDMLREITSIAAAHGSRALSEMLGKRINLTMPNLAALEIKNIQAADGMNKVVVSVQAKILSGATGSIIMVYDEASAFELVKMCCPDDGHNRGLLTELGFSALKEIGNVVMGAFAGALSIIIREPVIPSIPSLSNGPLQDVLHLHATLYGPKEVVIMVEACFEEAEKRVKGSLYFVVPEKTLKTIQQACKKLLKEI